jgi:hypothetical protein
MRVSLGKKEILMFLPSYSYPFLLLFVYYCSYSIFRENILNGLSIYSSSDVHTFDIQEDERDVLLISGVVSHWKIHGLISVVCLWKVQCPVSSVLLCYRTM